MPSPMDKFDAELAELAKSGEIHPALKHARQQYEQLADTADMLIKEKQKIERESRNKKQNSEP